MRELTDTKDETSSSPARLVDQTRSPMIVGVTASQFRGSVQRSSYLCFFPIASISSPICGIQGQGKDDGVAAQWIRAHWFLETTGH